MTDSTAPHEIEDVPVPVWQKIGAAVFAVVWITIVALWHSRFPADLYPPDRSFVAPNLLASFIIASLGLVVGVLVWPPTRRRLHRFVDKKLAPVHAHLTVLREHHEAAAERDDELLRHLKHVIRHHPDIPDLPEEP